MVSLLSKLSGVGRPKSPGTQALSPDHALKNKSKLQPETKNNIKRIPHAT